MDEEMTLEEINAAIKEKEAQIEKINKNEKKLQSKKKTLSNNQVQLRSLYQRELKDLNDKKVNFGKPVDPLKNNTNNNNNTGGETGGGDQKTPEEKYQEALKKQQELADQLNDANLLNKKLQDEKSALEQVQKGVDQVDDNVQENVPTWSWREVVDEMAPTDKAKRGFLITNHILNRLGTATGNIGAIVQNAGGSGGASLKEHGGSYLDQYRQSKMEQAIANRKTKQNARMQFQLDAYTAVGAEENRMREAQRRLRNSGFWGKYERLNNEQQVYLQGLLYEDTKGEITNAMIGNIIDKIMEGKDVSLEQVAVNSLAAAGVDNFDNIIKGAKGWGDKIANYLFGSKPGE